MRTDSVPMSDCCGKPAVLKTTVALRDKYGAALDPKKGRSRIDYKETGQFYRCSQCCEECRVTFKEITTIEQTRPRSKPDTGPRLFDEETE